MPAQVTALLQAQRALAPLVVLAVLSLATGPLGADEPDLPAPPKIDPGKESLIRQVIAATGTMRDAGDRIDRVIETLTRASPETPANLWKQLRGNVAPHEVFDLAITLYDRHYSREDLRSLLDFYRSPTGQEFLREMPKAA